MDETRKATAECWTCRVHMTWSNEVVAGMPSFLDAAEAAEHRAMNHDVREVTHE